MLGVAGVELTLQLWRLVGWPGGGSFALVIGTHGSAPSELVSPCADRNSARGLTGVVDRAGADFS